MRFDKRVAIVTGAGAGLGRAYAEFLAAHGARVLVNDVAEGADVVAAHLGGGDRALANRDSVVDGHKIVDAALSKCACVWMYWVVRVLINQCDVVGRGRGTSGHCGQQCGFVQRCTY